MQDILLHNTYRHMGHFACGSHWESRKSLPIFINHAAGFRHHACVTMQHDNAFQTGPVMKLRSQTYLRLKLLDGAVISEHLEGILDSSEIVSMVERRDGVLQYIDDLITEHGIENELL